MSHASTHTREAFLNLLERYVLNRLDKAELTQLHELTGALWNCTDTFPHLYCEDIEALADISLLDQWKSQSFLGTYGKAARITRQHLQREAEKGTTRVRVKALSRQMALEAP